MNGSARTALAVLLVGSVASPARAQTNEVWPEIGIFVKLNNQLRFYLIGAKVKEDRESTTGEFGPNLDIYLKPIRDRKHWVGFRLDESKNRLLHLRVGYRYLPSFSGDPDENRGVLEATARYPLVLGVLVSSRNRMDFRFIDGEYSWRYRNRLSMEKEFSIGRVRLNPYARAEVFYDSKFHEWSRTELIVGSAFPLNQRWELEGYFDHQHDTGNSPNKTVHAFGAVLNIYWGTS